MKGGLAAMSMAVRLLLEAGIRPRGDIIVQTVSAAFAVATGNSPTLSGRTGGADTRFLIKHGQTPTVIFGPGMTSEMHAMDESAPIANLRIAVHTLVLAIADWCGVA